MTTLDVLKELETEATVIHDRYMNMSGFFKIGGKWLPKPFFRRGDYAGNANGVFNVRCLIQNKIKEIENNGL